MPSAPLRLLALAAGAVHGLNTNTLLYGGANELKLLSAKYITSAGGSSAVFAGDNPNVKKQWSRFLYGDAPEAADAPGRVRLLTTLDELGACLSTVDSLVLLCNDAPLDENVVGTLFSNLGKACKRVVLVSRMGVTRAQPPGPFGFGGGDAALLATETAVRAAVAARGTAELSVVRVGTLKVCAWHARTCTPCTYAHVHPAYPCMSSTWGRSRAAGRATRRSAARRSA